MGGPGGALSLWHLRHQQRKKKAIQRERLCRYLHVGSDLKCFFFFFSASGWLVHSELFLDAKELEYSKVR